MTPFLQMGLFAVGMVVAAVLLIRRSGGKVEPELGELAIKPVCPYCWLWLLTEGVGGGFAIVPALVLLGNVPMKQAIGSSLLIISANAVGGLSG